MEKKEIKIGETFQCGVLTLKCIEGGRSCRGCLFFEDRNYECSEAITNILGECTATDRRDCKNAIFVKVKQ